MENYKQKYELAMSRYEMVTRTGMKVEPSYIFPELAESEDEKTRKEIIEFLNHSVLTAEETELLFFKKWIAYLEKQKVKEQYDRMAPIYSDQESFEDALEKAWKFYNDSGSSTVDGCEDNPIELSFAKGFREGFLYKDKQKEQKLVTFKEPCNSDEYEVVEVGDATCLRRKEQKPVEQIENNEEESIGTTLINALNGNARLEWELKRAGVNVQKLITYLKQNPAKWSEEDSVKIGTLSAIIFDYAFYKDALDENNDLTGEYAELDNWLGTLPERFELQPKQEWSYEDEKNKNPCL